MSALDDLLDLGGPSTTQTGGQLMDPFDPLGSSGTGENTGGGGDTLLDFGFDAPTSTQNGSSAKLNFEANTNPLYEFTSAESKMSADASSPLFELNSDAPQKEAKQEPSNPLYDFVQNEDTNGHGEDIIVNGDQEQNGGKQEVDLLGAGDSGNLLGDSGDLLGDSGPITSDDSGVTVDSNNVSGEQPREETEDVVETVEEEQDQAEPVKEEIPESTESVTDTQVEQSGPEDTNKGPEPEVLDTPDQGTKAEEEKQTSDMAKDDSEPAVVDNQAENVTDESKETATEVADAKEPEVEQGKEDDAASDGPELQEEGTEQFEDADPEEAKAPVEHVEEPVEAVQSESVEAEQPNGAEGEVPTEQKTEVEETKPEQIPEPVQTENEAQEPEPVVEEVQTETVDAPVETAPEPVVEPEGNQEVETVPEESKPEPPKEEVEVAQEQVEEPAAPVEPVETKDGDAVEEQATTEALKPTEETPAEETPAVETPAVETPTLVQVEEKPVEVIEEKQDTPVEEPEPPVENVAKPAEVEQPETADTPETLDIGDEGTSETRQSETVAKETRTSTSDENALKLNGTSDVKENGVEGEDAVRDPNVFRETREKEEVHFAEMNNVRQKFESGGASTQEETSPRTISLKDDYDQGGEFENEPVRNPDVVRETDQPGEELPEIGMAKNLRDRFQTIQEEKAKPVASSKRVSPPRSEEKVEYESTPTEHQVLDDVKVDEGVFESQPAESENVVRSGEVAEDFTPEKGSAKNILNKFKEIQTEGGNYKSDQKREITPDRSGKVEYVSEPRGEHITYEETKTDSGVFENVPKQEEDVVRAEDRADEVMPESGMAKNLLSKFKQMETEAGNKPPPSPGRVRQITPDRSGKVEFVSEPRGFLEKYEPQNESGEFENQPATRPEVIRSEDHAEDVMPESGTAKKTMERFRELQKQSTSPSNKSKEFTPPRETSPGRSGSGVYESTPEARPDVVRSGESVEEELPEQGTTRNILNKFKEIQTSGSQSSSPGRKQKEFTPPPESGVYENKPDEHLIIETRQSESGILESTPVKSTADVARERDSVSPESELPEQGLAKNLVSKWKQLESSSASAKSTSSTSPRFKEFTPPRDSRGPMSPKSPAPTDSGKTNGVHPSELPGQYQPQIEASILENNPEVRTGVTREADTDWEKDMPAPNTTLSMLQKFKSIQQKAKDDSSTPAPVTRKEKGMFRVVQTEKCSACEKTVYAMEKLEMNGHIYHKQCFKCSHCSARLTPKTFSMNEGIIYCVNHFKQLFARKGNYDEGFGRQQYKKKWQDEKKEGATA